MALMSSGKSANMKKNTLSNLLMAVFIVSVNAQPKKEWKIISPDHSLQLVVSLIQGNLSYRVLGGNQTIIKPSSLGIERADQKFLTGLSFISASPKKIDEQLTLKIGKRKSNHAVANGIDLAFKNGSAAVIHIDARAYNVGGAFRLRVA